MGAGNHIPPGVRILSLKQNPAQEWSDLRQAVMDRLKGENEALIKRLRELEESGHRKEGGSGDDLVPRESWEVVSTEKTELEEVVKQKEKRLLRLQQVLIHFHFPSYCYELNFPLHHASRYSQPKALNSARQ